MTRLDALRALLAKRTDHVHQFRIGHRVIEAKPAPSVRLDVVRVLKSRELRIA